MFPDGRSRLLRNDSRNPNWTICWPRHFILPFLAHALGTFTGAILAALIAASHNMKLALVIGAFFLIGGIANIFMLPSPTWFTILDLAGAYIPIAWLGGKMADGILMK